MDPGGGGSLLGAARLETKRFRSGEGAPRVLDPARHGVAVEAAALLGHEHLAAQHAAEPAARANKGQEGWEIRSSAFLRVYGENSQNTRFLTTKCHGERLADWYDHSLVEDDLPTSVVFDESMAEAITTNVRAQTKDPHIRS